MSIVTAHEAGIHGKSVYTVHAQRPKETHDHSHVARRPSHVPRRLSQHGTELIETAFVKDFLSFYRARALDSWPRRSLVGQYYVRKVNKFYNVILG